MTTIESFTPAVSGLVAHLHGYPHLTVVSYPTIGFLFPPQAVNVSSLEAVLDEGIIKVAISAAWVPVILWSIFVLLAGAVFAITMCSRCCCAKAECWQKLGPTRKCRDGYWGVSGVFAVSFLSAALVAVAYTLYLSNDVTFFINKVDDLNVYKDQIQVQIRTGRGLAQAQVDISRSLLEGCDGYSTPCSTQLRSDLQSAVDNTESARDITAGVDDTLSGTSLDTSVYIDPVTSYQTIGFYSLVGWIALVVLLVLFAALCTFPKLCCGVQGQTSMSLTAGGLAFLLALTIHPVMHITSVLMSDAASFDLLSEAPSVVLSAGSTRDYAAYYLKCINATGGPADSHIDSLYSDSLTARQAAEDLQTSLQGTGISDDTQANITLLVVSINNTLTVLNDTKTLAECPRVHDLVSGVLNRVKNSVITNMFVVAISVLTLFVSTVVLLLILPLRDLKTFEKEQEYSQLESDEQELDAVVTTPTTTKKKSAGRKGRRKSNGTTTTAQETSDA